MRRTTTALAALLLPTGCSAGEQDAEPDPAQPTESTSDAPAVDTRPPLVFDNGSSASVEGDCDDRAPVWFEVALPMTVRREVRLGEVTVAGDGRLARPVLVAPAAGAVVPASSAPGPTRAGASRAASPDGASGSGSTEPSRARARGRSSSGCASPRTARSRGSTSRGTTVGRPAPSSSATASA